MRALAGLLGVVALAACPLQTTKSLTLGSGASSASSSPASSSGGGQSSATSPDAERERLGEWHGQQGQANLDASSFLRAEFEALAGLTVAQATAQAKARGHTGEVRVDELTDFVAGCKDGIVCSATDQTGGQSGMGNADILVLRVNKKLSIAPPPD